MSLIYELDQYQEGVGAYQPVNQAESIWQSFTPSKDGDFGRVDIYVKEALVEWETTLRIYSGEGTGGTLLHSQSVTIDITSGGWQSIILSSPVALTGSQLFTINFYQPATNWNYWGWVSDYPTPVYYYGRCDFSADYDYRFRTYFVYRAITVSATIIKAQQGSITANAILQQGQTGSITANAFIVDRVEQSITANAVIAGTMEQSITAAAIILQPAQQGSVTASAVIALHHEGTVTVRAVIEREQQGSIAANAYIFKLVEQSITANAIIGMTTTGELSLNAVIDYIHYITISAYIVRDRAADRGQVMRLLYGNDKRKPKRVLNLADTDHTGKIFLREGGFTPAFGDRNISWSGRSMYRDGEDRLGGSAGNAALSISYDLNAGSMTELGYLQRKINRFLREIEQRHDRTEPMEKVWFEYRWMDRLASLPAPFFGQLSHYYEVLDMTPAMPGDMHSGSMVAGQIEAAVLELVCSPYPEGLPQRAGNAIGHVLETEPGVLIGATGTTNVISNCNFGHPTDWDYGWTRSSTTYVILNEETEICLSSGRAARIVNAHSSTPHGIYHTVSLVSGTFSFGFMCRLPDGGEVTTADVGIYTNGGTFVPTIVQVPGTDWYFCYYSGAGGNSFTQIGPAAQPQREIIVDNIRYFASASPAPFFSGDMLSAAWAGTAFESNATLTAGGIKYAMVDEFCGTFSFGGWVAPHTYPVPTDGYILRYLVDASNEIALYISSGTLVLLREFAGVPASDTCAISFSPYVPVHLEIVQDHGSLGLFVNGVQQIDIATGPGMPANGSLYLGCDEFASYTANLIFDGWRGFRVPLSSTQTGYIYANELPVKQAGGTVGPPPFFWTKDGDGVLDNYCDGSSHANWGILGGISGDLAAEVEWRFNTPSGDSTPGQIWLGRKAVELDPPGGILNPYGTLHFDRDGIADSGYGVVTGGEYVLSTDAIGSTWIVAGLSESVEQPEFLRGRWRWMFSASMMTNDFYIRPVYRLGTADYRVGSSQLIAEDVTDATMKLEASGNWDMLIDWPVALGKDPGSIDIGFQVKGDYDISNHVATDFFQLMPYPFFRITADSQYITVGGTDMIVVKGMEAYQENGSGHPETEFEHEGDVVTVEPKHNNYIFMMAGVAGLYQFEITHTMQLTPIVTPRWLIAGPPVA